MRSERGPEYDQAVVDLCGVLAYAELTAFERLAFDARMAPTIGAKAALAGMASAEFDHFRRLSEHLRTELGVEPEQAMAPFVKPLDEFHDLTAPADWIESLVKAYVGDGIGVDFYREVAELVDDPTRSLVLDVLADTGHSEFVVDQVKAAIARDPALAGRLALWARRLVGEALTQAQRVAVDRDNLARLIVGDVGGHMGDLAAVGRMFARLTEAHTMRLATLGLSA
jgi:hypothetical protein